MNSRRQFLSLPLILLVMPPAVALGQKPRKIGVLASREKPASMAADYLGEIPRGLAELGRVEGKNLVIEWRFADGKYERLDALALELVRAGVEVIVTDGTPSTLAARRATKTIPIVFGGVGDPLGSGIVQNLARPGGNATGLSLLGEDTSKKQLEILVSLVPGIRKVAALCNLGNPLATPILESLRKAGQAMNLEVVAMEARTREGIETSLSRAKVEKAGAVIVVMDPFYIQERRRIVDLAAQNGLASMASASEFPEAGGVISYGQNRVKNYRRAAGYVDQILKGASPSDLPVEQSINLELVLNKKAAKQLGLTVPADLLLLADRVIE